MPTASRVRRRAESRHSPRRGGSTARSAMRLPRWRAIAARGSSSCATRSASSSALGLAAGEAQALIEERNRLANRGRLAESAPEAHSHSATKATATTRMRSQRARPACCAAQRPSIRALEPALALVEEVADRARRGRARSWLSISTGSMRIRRGRTRSSAASRAIEDLARKHRVEAPALPAEARGTAIRARDARTVRISCWAGSTSASPVLRKRYAAAAAGLAARRGVPRHRLATAVTSLMRQLGMPGGRFEIAVETDADSDPQSTGADRIEFLVSANPGEPPKPVAESPPAANCRASASRCRSPRARRQCPHLHDLR